MGKQNKEKILAKSLGNALLAYYKVSFSEFVKKGIKLAKERKELSTGIVKQSKV